MLNLVCRIKFHNGSFSCVGSFSSAHKFFLPQLTRFSSSAANSPKPESENSNQDSFPANYLKNAYRFSPEKALMYSKHLTFDSPEKPDSVIAFFKNHHFTDKQISVIVKKWPLVFNYVPESSFLPKIEFFHSLGFSSSNIVRILTWQPGLLGESLEFQIIPCVDFLRSFLHSDKDVRFSIMRFPGIIGENLQGVLLPNVEILRGAGVPEYLIAALLKTSPKRIAVRPEIFRVTVKDVQEVGINPQKKSFLEGIIVMREAGNSTWKQKIELFERWGWSQHQLMAAFRMYPRFMEASEDKINKILDLFAKKIGDFSVLMTRPRIFCLDFEKIIAPRCAFHQIWSSRGLVKHGSELPKMLECSQRLFSERYVQPYAEKDPELLKQYQEIFSNLK